MSRHRYRVTGDYDVQYPILQAVVIAFISLGLVSIVSFETAAWLGALVILWAITAAGRRWASRL